MNGLYIKGLKTSINDVLLWRANDQYIHSTARVFAIINSSINVFIYGVFNKKFKTTFYSLFWKCLAQNKNGPYGTINTNSKDGLSSKRTTMMLNLHTINWSIFLDLYICNFVPYNVKEKYDLNKLWCNKISLRLYQYRDSSNTLIHICTNCIT